MIRIKPKTRSLIEIKTIEDILPYLPKWSKNWKSLTPLVKSRLEDIIDSNSFFPGLSHLGLVIRKNVLEMRSGTFSKEHYVDIFGWTINEAEEMLKDKGQLFKESTGGITPGQKEFYVIYHGMSEEDAIKAVSIAQQKLSTRKKKTTVNQPTSLKYYIHRGMTEDEAAAAQSLTQKKRRNNCIEYWTNKGYSEEDAKTEISKIQKTRSQLSIDYWLTRGYSLEQAQEESVKIQNKQFPGKFSKISQKFFKELITILKEYGYSNSDFKFGEQEECVFITPKRRVYLDFLHIESKKVIEFDGKYWHHLQEEQDADRDKLLNSLGYSILRIPETYNKQLWYKYLTSASEFITGNQYENS